MSPPHHFAVRLPDLTAFPRELDEKVDVHGLHLKTAKGVQVGETVAIQFRFPQREDPLLAEGVVAWVAPQPDAQGKRSLVVRHLKFDAEALRIIDLVRSTPAVEESNLSAAANVAPSPPPPPHPAPPPGPEARDEEEPGDHGDIAADGVAKKKRRLIVLVLLLLLLALLLGWLFGLGGLRWVQMRFMAPPPALTVGPRDTVAQPEPPLVKPKPEPAPVRIVPPAVATGFDYFQRPAMNEFIITFNRPLSGKVVERRNEDPLMHTFYLEHADARLDKDQFFLSFDMVRTVLFERDGSVLRISFIAQNAHYMPQPVYEVRGRELLIRFIAQD